VRTRLTVLFIAVLAATSAVVVLPQTADAAPASGGYTALAPTRLLDTRTTTGGHHGAVGANAAVAIKVTGGSAAVPSSASAVVLNVTVTGPTRSGFITAYADAQKRPRVSNLNYSAGQTVPNLVVAPVGTDGKVDLYNGSAGSTQLVADLQGYFTGDGSPIAQGGFGAVAPTRLLDTRVGTGATKRIVGPDKSVSFVVTGTHGSARVPSASSAVVLNVTATAATASGFVTAYGAGGSRPSSSNLNYVKGRTVPNLVVAPVGDDGKVTLYNSSSGSVQLIADIQGYFTAGDPIATGAFGALSPVRLLDTRVGNGAKRAAVGARKTVTVSLFGRGGVPRSPLAAAVLNVTVTGAGAGGYLTAYSDSRPTASNLNFAKGQTIANLVVVKPSSGGMVTFYNGSSGSVQIIADVFGYVRSTAAPSFKTSTSHYIRNLTGAAAGDVTAMHNIGCSDKEAGSSLVLLDIGAQSITSPLSAGSPGVALTGTSPVMRLTYGQLVTALNGYLDGYASCSGSAGSATIAIGTSNDGTWSTYAGSKRGTDWANLVVDAVATHTGITVVGADDIESTFGTRQASDALAWEKAYLAATSAGLIFNGSADGCPATYGAPQTTCASGWTQVQYYTLAHNGSRIRALPQIYYPDQAIQWANIDLAGGNGITFAGSLTEHAAACGADCAMTPAFGWAALYHALSTVSASPSLPYVTDLKIN
jgi:hypothetical protein